MLYQCYTLYLRVPWTTQLFTMFPQSKITYNSTLLQQNLKSVLDDVNSVTGPKSTADERTAVIFFCYIDLLVILEEDTNSKT